MLALQTHPNCINIAHLPVFCCRCSVSLPPVFKPVSDLCRSESSGLRQFPFLARVGIRVLQVPLPQQTACPFLETVRLLLAVPDGSGQRKLLAHSVLIDGSERAPPQLLGLLVVSLEPHGLQFSVRVLGELVVFQDMIEVAEVARVEGDNSTGAQDGLVLVNGLTCARCHRQRPQKATQSLDVAGLLKRLADARHLLRGEVEGR